MTSIRLVLRCSRRLILSPRHVPLRSQVRLFSNTKKPDWMIEAELEAISATNARAAKSGTANDTMMSKLTHEMASERVSNALKLEEKLRTLLQKCQDARSGATDTRGRKIYSTLRKKASEMRQELITQREAAGMVTDAATVVEAAFPLPPRV